MLKKTAFLATATLMTASTLFGDASLSTDNNSTHYSGGVVLGGGITTLQSSLVFGGNAGNAFQVGYYGENGLFDIGVSFTGNSKMDPFHTFLIGHAGFRNHLFDNLFISYGVMGLGNFVSKGDNNQWSVGAFTGLDYQFSRHFMLSAKVYPYNYDHRYVRTINNIFANSTLSLFYVF